MSIVDLCRFIESADALPALDELAARAGLSPYHLHRVFKAVTGLTPRAYAAAHRARRVREQLGRSGTSVTEAIYDAGYNANSRFYEESGRVLGMTPSAWRAGGADTEIRFAIGQCSLGAILVARSAHGVCAIALGDDPEALARELQDRFPNARLMAHSDGCRTAAATATTRSIPSAASPGRRCPRRSRGSPPSMGACRINLTFRRAG